jgi:hypothetical protein
MKSRKLAIIVILAALSVSTNYAMMALYNVKFMDFIVFVGGFCFGSVVGSLIGIFSWLIYGSLNPLGFSFPIWVSTMFSEVIYGVGGALVRKSLRFDEPGEIKNGITTYFFFGIIGIFLTFIYDIITNIVFGWVVGWNILFAIIMGFVPFGIIHATSNAFFFGLGCVPIINAITKIVGGEKIGVPEK